MTSTYKLYPMVFANSMNKTFSLALPRSQLSEAIFGILMVTMFVSPSMGQDDWRSEMRKINPQVSDTFNIDDTLVEAAGIQKISGNHIDLYTDVRDEQKTNELVAAFDQAVSQWCAYFGLAAESAKSWKMRAFLIADKDNPTRFQRAGLIPEDLPDFKAGFQRRHNFWLYLQPGNYYTRHLLLHEGTHGFMLWFLRGHGPAWYSEGMAELLGVHQWKDNLLQLNYRLRNREEAEYWGRVKRIRSELNTENELNLEDILNIPPAGFNDVRYYAWAWAGCEFFQNHPKTKQIFSTLPQIKNLDQSRFNREFLDSIKNHLDVLKRDWQLFINEIDYGYSVSRGCLSEATLSSGRFGSSRTKFQISAERSWQVTELKVQQGERLRVESSGEFVVGQSSPLTPWKCQSNGITIQYYRGRPLGRLQVGILNRDAKTSKQQIKGLLNPLDIGISGVISAPTNGVLCFRINESPAFLRDNRGALEVVIEKLE